MTNVRSTIFAFLLALASTLTDPAAAQLPAEDWRTIETRYFRVHYPVGYEEWSARAAARLESIREAVSADVGFAPSQTIDVVVMNPAAELNGSAWPFLKSPRMLLYAEPPGGSDQFGAYEQWSDLLIVHETAHLVHLLRPSRSPRGRLIEKLLIPLSPIAFGAPRWVTEGYATTIEGRLTGGGRPNSTIRALILRRWAASGRLPSYDELESNQRFMGMRMAYYVGSAYLEWLEKRSGPESLRKLWAHMTARSWPAFGTAFADVFGESPERLYGRFTAELTASAMTLERRSPLLEGELFQETTGASGDPAVSPDGMLLAVVKRKRQGPHQLVVWSTAPPTEEEKKYEDRVRRILERDPDDVRPVRNKPLPRKNVHTLVLSDGGDIVSPRWTRDGKALIFSHRTAGPDGVLHFDLYRWDFERLTRITRLADTHDADPSPDGRTAVAVRSRFGKTQLVNVDLSSGAVTERTPLSIDVIRSHPRVSPDGSRVAHVSYRTGARTLVIDDRELSLPGEPASPEWISNDELVVTLFSRGFAELYRVRFDGVHSQVTSSAGGAFDPAAAADGRVFFMSLEPDGYVVRVLSSLSSVATMQTHDPALVPALPPEPRGPSIFKDEDVTSRRYGLGRQEPGWFTGMNVAPDYQTLEIGIRLGDLVGRLDTILLGSVGRDEAPSGLAIASAWRGWPVEVQAHAFHQDEVDTCLSFRNGPGRGPCPPSSGLELRGMWRRHFAQSQVMVEAGALSDDRLFGAGSFSTFRNFGRYRVRESLRVDVDDEHYRATATSSFSSGALRLAARYQLDRGARISLGGLPSSIVPRSVYLHHVLDSAIPSSTLTGDDYNGWRFESTIPVLPLTAFYQRHEVGTRRLSLAGFEFDVQSDPLPVLKLPGLDFTAGVARVLDAPLEGETKWWLGMRWRP